MKRLGSLDVYRGVAVVLMVFFNFLPLLSYGTPFVLLHNQGNVLLPGDLVAPMFQFMVGVSLALALERKGDGGMMKRFAFLVLLGLFLDAVTYMNPLTWGVLETLGVAGMVAFFLRKKSDVWIAAFCAVLLAAYALASTSADFTYFLYGLPHGGPLGALSFSVMTLGGMVVGRHAMEKRFLRRLLPETAALLLLGVCLSEFIPFNKLIVSASYSVFATGSSALIFAFIYWLVEIRKAHVPYLPQMGGRALTIWVMQFALVFWPLYFIFRKTNFLPLELGALASALLVIVFYFISGALEKRGIRMAL